MKKTKQNSAFERQRSFDDFKDVVFHFSKKKKKKKKSQQQQQQTNKQTN